MITRRMALSIVAIVILTSIVVYSADAAGIPKKAISTVSRFIESDLPTTTLFTDVQNTITSIQQFTTTSAVFENPAKTFGTTIAGGAVAANRTLNLPAITGTDTVATLGLAQTFTGAQTINSLILGGDLNVGSNGLTTSGHKGTLPTNTGTFLYTNGSFTGTHSSGSISSGVTITSLSNAGHVSTFPSNTGTILQANGSLSTLTGNLNTVGGTFTGTLSGGTLSGSISGTPTLTGRNMFTGGALINGTTVTMVTKTSSYTATATDDVIYVNATSNPTTITLPSATTIGKIFTIIKKDSTTSEVTIASNGGTVAGNTTRQLQNAGDTLQVISDGTNWIGTLVDTGDISSFHTKGSSKNRYITEAVTQNATGLARLSANVLNAFPLVVSRTITIDSMEYEITTAVSSGSCRVGIYTDNGTSYPYALVSNTDIGARGTGTTGMKTNATAATVTLLGNNLYWVAYNCGTAPTVTSVTQGALANVLGYSTATGGKHQGTGWTVARAFAALPATYPSGGTVLDNIPAPLIGLRIKG